MIYALLGIGLFVVPALLGIGAWLISSRDLKKFREERSQIIAEMKSADEHAADAPVRAKTAGDIPMGHYLVGPEGLTPLSKNAIPVRTPATKLASFGTHDITAKEAALLANVSLVMAGKPFPIEDLSKALDDAKKNHLKRHADTILETVGGPVILPGKILTQGGIKAKGRRKSFFIPYGDDDIKTAR